MDRRRRKLSATLLAGVVAVMLLSVAPQARAEAVWPPLTELAQQDQGGQIDLPLNPPPPPSGDEIRTTIAAPVPPAVFTGTFLLASNWFASMLWKKRKI